MKKIRQILDFAEVKNATILALILLAIISSFFTVIPTNILGALAKNIVIILTEKGKGGIVVQLFIAYSVTLILGAVIRNVFCYLTSKLSNRIIFNIKNVCYSKFLNIESQQVTQTDFGTITNVVLRNAERLELVFSTSFFTLLSDLFDLVIMSIFLSKISPLVLVIFLFVLPITYTLAKKSGIKQKKLALERIEIEKETINKLNESYNNFDVIRIFGGQEKESCQFKSCTQDYNDIANQADKKLSEFFVVEKTLRILSTVVALSYISMQILRGEIDVGNFVIVAMYSEKFFSPVTNMIRYLQYIQKGIASIDNILEFLSKADNKPQENRETKDLYPVLIHGNTLKMKINDNYVGQSDEVKILDRTINLIIGDNGSGKSSLVRMLLGLIDNNNYLQIDNRLTQEQETFSYVPQKANLFNLSVLENCFYPHSINEVSQEAIEQAKLMLLKLNFPRDQINKLVKENGSNLSDGERKKVNFVRALLNRAPILVLDEVTANVDNSSIEVMEQYLVEERAERAVIMISHQVSENVLSCSQNIIRLKRERV